MSRIIFEQVLGCKRTAAVVGAVLVALAVQMALWTGPTGAQTCPPGEPDCLPPRPPTVEADDASVVAVEGQTATNTGTYSDDNPFDDVDITASVGNVTQTGTNSGTWSWSLGNAAPLGRQQVTITATDSTGESSTTEFTLTVTYPNGKIAFTRSGLFGAEIRTMNLDGSGQTPLADPASGNWPAFSRDGTRIAFVAFTGSNNLDIFVVNANGGGQRRLTNNPALDDSPSFSSDGTRIVFTSGRDGNPEIYVMNSDGTGQTRLTNNSAHDFGPSFSPDGEKIVFASSRDGNDEIYLMNAAPESPTNQPQRLTNNSADDFDPSFSPDGTRIVFVRGSGDSQEIYVMNANGTNPTRLTNNTTNDDFPSWGGASDTTPPETTVTSGPSGPVNSSFAEFRFSSSEPDSVFECSLNSAPFSRCTSPQPYFALPEGQHTFQVRATDVSGNTDPTPASRTWTVDTTAPNTTIDSGPSGSLNTPSVSFAFSSSEANSTFGCRLTRQGETPGSFTACSSPKEYPDLTDGGYTFEVRATDAAGNTDASPASRTWTVDATTPSAPAITSPANNSYDTDGNFTVSGTAEAGSTVELFEDGVSKGTDQADASGNWSKELSGVAEGSHTYTAKAKDAAGNISGSSDIVTVTMDMTAPTLDTDNSDGSDGVTPDNGATGVSRLTNVTAAFSEDMDPATLTTSTVTLTKAGSTTPVQAAVSYDEATKTVTLDPFPDNPTQKLARRTTYTAKIEGAKDLAGNPLAATTWSFKTKRR